MQTLALAYLAGLLIALASRPWPLALVASAAALVLLGALRWSAWRWPAAFALGLAWGGVAAHGALAARLAPALEGRVLAIGGRVAEFPGAAGADLLIVFDRVIAHGRVPAAAPQRILLHWSAATAPPRLGAWCELRVRLSRPRGLANPGGRDRERDLFARHIGARGHVLDHPANLCAPIADRHALSSVRAALSAAIAAAVPDSRSAAVIRALAVDDRSALTSSQWDVMQATGTSHLISISGLHVSIVALGTGFLGRYLAALVGVRRQGYPALRVGCYAALAAALGYAALAGFGIPVQRAALMVGVAVAARLSGRRILGWDSWLAALLAMATLDPLCLLATGAWLSFGAVAVLIWLVTGWARRPQGLAGAWRTHLAMSLALAPLTGLLFGGLAVAAPLANLIAVPFSSILVVPLTVLGVVCAGWNAALAGLLWDMAGRLWDLLWQVLVWLAAHLPQFDVSGLVDGPGMVLASAGLWLAALPRALPTRALACLLLASLLVPRAPPLGDGEFRLRVFDVGQGLAVLVETRASALLYDSGPRWWGSDTDAGAAVVVPALAALRVRRLAVLVISHADLDHAGGAPAVLAALPVARVLWSEPIRGLAPPLAQTCRAPARWQADGVRFSLLHPSAADSGSRNERSCVLLIEGRYGRALLPGDIEAGAETRLLARAGAALRADVLIAPHHGSRTSSSTAFIAAVRPSLVLIPAGYRNRYGFPHAAVLARYRERGARVLNTAEDGALMVAFTARGRVLDAERAHGLGFWR